MYITLIGICFAMILAPAAMADDPPLFGSEATGAIRISLPEKKLNQHAQAPFAADISCTGQGCPRLLNAAMQSAEPGAQP